MKIDVKELQKINLGEGDVLVIKIKPYKVAIPSDLNKLDEMLSECFPHNKVIIARPGDKFEIIKQGGVEK